MDMIFDGGTYHIVPPKMYTIMHINQEEFFREATLRICGSLEIETVLYGSFMYLRQVMPADRVYLVHYYYERDEQFVLAMASEKGCSMLNLVAPVPPESRKYIEHPELKTLITNRAEEHPIARPWIAQGFVKPDESILTLRLFLDEKYIGAVVFFARGSNKFTQEHADRLALLREPFAIALSNSLRYKEVLELQELLAEDNRFLQNEILQAIGDEIIGAEFGLKDVMHNVRQVAPLSSPVLLLGETGTGKEVIASAIHHLSSRATGPFIKINCGAIPEQLVDSELFGHEKGAFTGAISRKRGRFERAKGGTIFLDEIGELQLEAQVRLLRVLQEKEIERIGGTEPIEVDIRVIAATHRNLGAMIHGGTFREDLYFRLNVFPIVIPPLRQRTSDIPALLQYFLRKKALEIGKQRLPALAPGALERLMTHLWPGNVRELENTVERELILNRGELLAFEDIRAPAAPNGHREPVQNFPHATPPENEPFALDEVVSRHILRILEMTSGKVGGKGGAADLLQVNPSTLRKRMRKLGIPFGKQSRQQ